MKKKVAYTAMYPVLLSLLVGCAGSKGGGSFKGYGIDATFNYDNAKVDQIPSKSAQ